MSKTKLFIIIILILSLAAGVILGLYFYTNKSTTELTPVNNTDKNIFGGVGGVRTDLPKDTTNSTSNQEPETSRPTSTSTPQVPPLRMIHSSPVSGFTFITKDIYSTSSILIASSSKNVGKKQIIKPKIIGQEEKIRFIERGTGYVYETASSSLKNLRISNSTQTRMLESLFDLKGENIIFRGLLKNSDIIETKLSTLFYQDATSTELSLKTKDLEYNILFPAMSPEKDSLVYYTETKGVESIIKTSKLDGTGTVTIYKSPFREWLLSWPNKDIIVLNTKPSAYANGFAYTINPKTKSFKRLVGEKAGLTTLMSPDGLKVLVGESVDGSIKLSVLDTKNNSTKDLFLKVLPEKCVWSKLEKSVIYCAAGEAITYAPYPDAWYQGLVFFDDNIWKINVETQENKLLVVTKDFIKTGLDIINMNLSKKEDYIIFSNKKDLSLWGFEIPRPKTELSTSTKSVEIKNPKSAGVKSTSTQSTKQN